MNEKVTLSTWVSKKLTTLIDQLIEKKRYRNYSQFLREAVANQLASDLVTEHIHQQLQEAKTELKSLNISKKIKQEVKKSNE